MTSLDRWVVDAAQALGVRPDEVPADLRNGLLDLVELVDSRVGPLAGPMTGYLLGIAAGRGMSPKVGLTVLQDLASSRSAEAGGQPPEPAGPPAPGADTTVPAARVLPPPPTG